MANAIPIGGTANFGSNHLPSTANDFSAYQPPLNTTPIKPLGGGGIISSGKGGGGGGGDHPTPGWVFRGHSPHLLLDHNRQ